MKKVVVNPAYQSYAAFLSRLPETYDGQGEVLHDGRNTVRRIVHEGHVFIVKRFKRPILIQRVIYTCLRPTKACRAYQYALRFLELGIDTPSPIAYIEVVNKGLFSQGYFVAEEDRQIPSHCLEGRFGYMSPELMTALAAQLYEMHKRGVLHGDLNPGNILCERTPEGGFHFSFIDINRTRFIHGLPSRRCAVNNLWRLMMDEEQARFLFSAYARMRGWEAAPFVEAISHRSRRQQKKKRWLHAITFRC